jgi:hypothetical protein
MSSKGGGCRWEACPYLFPIASPLVPGADGLTPGACAASGQEHGGTDTGTV